MEVAIAAHAKRQSKKRKTEGTYCGESTTRLQRAVLSLLPEANTMEKYVLRMNPHLWCNDSTYAVYRDPNLRKLKRWNQDWPKLAAFLRRHPGIEANEMTLAYHATKNTFNVIRILFEGLDPKCRKFTPLLNKAYFGASTEACKQYGDIVLFAVPKSACCACNDGTFVLHEYDALPIGTYQKPSSWSFGDLFCGR